VKLNKICLKNREKARDSAENFFGNIMSTRLKYTILKPKDIGK
jgi:hypothetical protein